MPQVLKDFMTISAGISCQASFTHQRTRFLVGAFFLPDGVYSNGPLIIHTKYFLWMLSLNGLFKHLSSGCKTGVRPLGMTATSIFLCFRAALTSSVKWARKESHTNSDCSRVLCKHWRIHSLTPDSSIYPFLWKETRREFGMTRSLGVRTPLKITFGGSLVPSAATASATVKLRFSAPQVLTATVRLTVNSRERNEGSWNHIGVSSMLKMRDKGYPTRCLAAITNRWNCITFSSMSSGSHWASVVFCTEADRVASFPVLVPAKWSLKCRISRQFFCFLAKHQSANGKTYQTKWKLHVRIKRRKDCLLSVITASKTDQ